MKKFFLLVVSLFIIHYSLFIIHSPSPIFADCDPGNHPSREGVSRTNPGDACSKTESQANSCATSFTIFDEVTYSKMDPRKTIEETTDGVVTIDATKVTIPFVGFSTGEDENKYIADYFEGTNEYYANYHNQNLITNYQGILRKLTPSTYQDQLKKEMVERLGYSLEYGAESKEALQKGLLTTEQREKIINDYTLKYTGRICWQAPFWAEALKTLIKTMGVNLPDITNYCIFESDSGPTSWIVRIRTLISPFVPEETEKWLSRLPGMFHVEYQKGVKANLSVFLNKENLPNEESLPPETDDKDYIKKYLSWKKRDAGFLGNIGPWYKLWQVIPLVSREDSVGYMEPEQGANKNPKDIFEYADIISEEARITNVPHLARLNELTKNIGQLLLPYQHEIEIVEAPEDSSGQCIKEALTTNNAADWVTDKIMKLSLKANEEFTNPYYDQCWAQLQKYTTSYDPNDYPPLSCFSRAEHEVSRGIDVKLKHPYLNPIWGYTAAPNSGMFNLFRPYGEPTFEDIEAVSYQPINYSYIPGSVSPQQGYFYYPHLGGLQRAKEWTVNQALWPYEK